MKNICYALLTTFAMMLTSGIASAETAKVFFKDLHDGETVSSPVKVEMGVEGMTVVKAGEVKEGTGHHHLIIDGVPAAQGEIVAKDATHLHFGDGSTEALVPLTPGKHTLTLQFANGVHASYGPEMSTTITVNVK